MDDKANMDDFNHFDTKDLCRDFQLKQLVDKPTRGPKILDTYKHA